MYALFEDAGKLQAGRVMSEAEASAQIELASGKRVKVKATHLLLKFDRPEPATLLSDAQAMAEGIELDLAWEFAPEDEFGFADLAREYYGGTPGAAQQAAALMRLHEAPHYFRRAGKGRFRKAPADILRQALAAIEKKKQVQAQIGEWAGQLAAGQCPDAIREQLFRILFRPDKNAPEYRAVVEAARATQTAPLALLRAAGAIASPYAFHWQRFLFEHFPRGTGFAPVEPPAAPQDLPLAEVQAFSIDDSQTTEIDDALSVQGLGTGTVTLGIHIAAPALAMTPGDALDRLARERLSTVYMPGHKITMLPDAVVERFTLAEGRECPAVSLYVTLDESSLEISASRTALERVPIAHNLRHDWLDALITEDWLAGAAESGESDREIGHQPARNMRPTLSFLYRLACTLKARREQVRGRPETFTRPDYAFRLEGVQGEAPDGSETVSITPRRRGAPLDLIVAEAMILANSQWGQWLASLGVPAIYRSQASLAPGVKVRMGTKALPHAGLGVTSYAWSTSPLRRYTDLVNQWQIVAAARHGRTAALAAPFKPRDAALMAIISAFDAAYTAYNAHQQAMERFWTLRWLRQEGVTELEATLLRDAGDGPALARAEGLPLVLGVFGAQGLPRGARVRLRLGEADEVALDISATVLARLDADATAGDGEPAEDAEEDLAAGPLNIAVDLDEAEAPPTPSPADNPAP